MGVRSTWGTWSFFSPRSLFLLIDFPALPELWKVNAYKKPGLDLTLSIKKNTNFSPLGCLTFWHWRTCSPSCVRLSFRPSF